VGSALLLALLIPAAGASRRISALDQSIRNCRDIGKASSQFMHDHRNEPPFKMSFNFGKISGWYTWSFGGKNCNDYWRDSFGGAFDEPAFSRPLNAYAYPDVDIPEPPGYDGTPENFNEGNPLDEDRLSLQLPMFKSPRDRATRQRNWPRESQGISCYDDVGTSYLTNMRWWFQGDVQQWSSWDPDRYPGSARWMEGMRRYARPRVYHNPARMLS